MYNNPYLYQSFAKPSLLGGLFGKTGMRSVASKSVNWGNVLSNTQKGLGIINQAIPIVNQVKPMVTNAKTMFKIAGAMREKPNFSNQKKDTQSVSNNVNKSNKTINTNKPIFYV